MGERRGPTHIVAQPGDRKALCGVKRPLPVVWGRFAPLHSYDHPRCTACYIAAGLMDDWQGDDDAC